MTYQRNIGCLPALEGLEVQKDVLDEVRERQVGDPEIGADDRHGDDDDDRRREELVLTWPLDLLELGDRLRDEAAEAAAALAARAGLALRLAGRLDLAATLARALCGSLVVVAPAARAGLAGHDATASPDAGCGRCTSGSTSSPRTGRACSASTSVFDSCAACIPCTRA